jgi:hypothetical protein
MFAEAMAAAYRDTVMTEMLRGERERSALVTAILEGRVIDEATLWDAADVLKLPSHGPSRSWSPNAPAWRKKCYRTPSVACAITTSRQHGSCCLTYTWASFVSVTMTRTSSRCGVSSTR